MHRAKVFILIGVFSSFISVQGQTFFERLTKPNFIGGGLVLTHQDGLGGMSAVGPGLDLYVQYQLSPQWFMAFGTGLYTITDKTLSTENFKSTLFPNLEVRGGYGFNPGGKFMPFVQGGLHLFGSKSTATLTFPAPIGTITATSDTRFDTDLFFGVGADYVLNDKLAIRLGGDYRLVLTGDVSPKPKFWMAKVGVRYALSSSPTIQSSEEIEYPIDQGELALDDLFKEDNGEQTKSSPAASESNSSLDELFAEDSDQSTVSESGSGLDDLFAEDGGGSTSNTNTSDEADALALLFSDNTSTDFPDNAITESETPAYANTEISDLMNKVQNLKSEMLQKNQQIEDLKNKVNSNEKALAELSQRVGGGYSETGSFSVDDDAFKMNYEKALTSFNARRYNESIQLFQALLKTTPDNKLSSNCEYWIGESYNQIGDYEHAIQAFKAVLRYRSSYKFDDALLMTGLCSLKLGDQTTAKENFQELVSRYPDSEYAPKAMRYLGSL